MVDAMPLDVEVVTETGAEFIVDPAVLEKSSGTAEALETLRRAGQLAVRRLGDGGPRFRLYGPGEQVPRSFLARSQWRATGRLQLPTGRVALVPGERLSEAARWVRMTVEPGWYEVTIAELDLRGVVEWLAARAERRVAPRGARLEAVLSPVFAVCAVGLFFVMVGLTVLGWWSTGWPFAVGLLAVVLASGSALAWTPGSSARAAAALASTRRFPTTLVVLERSEMQAPAEGPLLRHPRPEP
jgi:hypothetical protein